jgi:hypothetical protein
MAVFYSSTPKRLLCGSLLPLMGHELNWLTESHCLYIGSHH